MPWRVHATADFAEWFDGLTEDEQAKVVKVVGLLGNIGPSLGRPHADTLNGSKHTNMKELRPSGSTLRVLFAFDPKREALLLVGGDKSGDPKFYRRIIQRAEVLYDEHVKMLEEADKR